MKEMQSRLNAKQQQIDFHKTRADEYQDQLRAFQINEADSNYDIKVENDNLKSMLSHWVQRAKALENQLSAKADDEENLENILEKNSNIYQQELETDIVPSAVQTFSAHTQNASKQQ